MFSEYLIEYNFERHVHRKKKSLKENSVVFLRVKNSLYFWIMYDIHTKKIRRVKKVTNVSHRKYVALSIHM